MLRRYGSWVVAVALMASVATACIVRTRPARYQRPVYVESDGGKQKHQKIKEPKPEKHKKMKHHD